MAIMNRQAEIMLRIAGEFGFTPASRSRNFSYAKSKSMLLLEPELQPSPDCLLFSAKPATPAVASPYLLVTDRPSPGTPSGVYRATKA